jgi:hypothetical protein
MARLDAGREAYTLPAPPGKFWKSSSDLWFVQNFHPIGHGPPKKRATAMKLDQHLVHSTFYCVLGICASMGVDHHLVGQIYFLLGLTTAVSRHVS